MSERAWIELLFGHGAHANPLACVEQVSLQLAGRRVDGFPHSIWQLVAHMNYWMDYELRRIRGDAPAYPQHAAESWLSHAVPFSEAKWEAEVARFSALLSQLASFADSGPEALAREVRATHPDHEKHSASLHAVLWQTLVHNSYHLGQIALLRQALGAWPPPGGGDSW
jgi:uncharacterized damage-inducible protein DinB